MIRLSLAVLLSGFAAISANAGLVPISYSMPNGDFTFNAGYGDETYDGSHCPECPNYLSGGLGQLTDGVTVPSFVGIGAAYSANVPYMVGWQASSVTITAFFNETQTFGSVGLHLSDGHGQLGIVLPATVTIAIRSFQPNRRTLIPTSATNGIGLRWHRAPRGPH